jgi:peroxiredoxin Q/BCP
MGENGRPSVGDRVPEFRLPDQNGREVNLSDLLGKGPLVIYFYPGDETPGCTKEACSFRDAYEDLRDAGADVIGISSDPVGSHREFARHHRLPFVLLSDQGGTVRRKFKVPRTLGIIPGRVTYVIDKNGIIRYVFSSQFKAEAHIRKALEYIREMD